LDVSIIQLQREVEEVYRKATLCSASSHVRTEGFKAKILKLMLMCELDEVVKYR
jgi:hypothetical protein